MVHYKIFCLNCFQTNACKCGTVEYTFPFSYKLRPPSDITKKVKWRKFIQDCPAFINLVQPELSQKFNEFLEKIKWNQKHINGFKTPIVIKDSKKEKFIKNSLSYCPKKLK